MQWEDMGAAEQARMRTSVPDLLIENETLCARVVELEARTDVDAFLTMLGHAGIAPTIKPREEGDAWILRYRDRYGARRAVFDDAGVFVYQR